MPDYFHFISFVKQKQLICICYLLSCFCTLINDALVFQETMVLEFSEEVLSF